MFVFSGSEPAPPFLSFVNDIIRPCESFHITGLHIGTGLPSPTGSGLPSHYKSRSLPSPTGSGLPQSTPQAQVTSQNTLIKLAWEQKEVVMPMSLFHRSFT